ncbi:MAG: cytochrome C [Cyanobacteria bacterium J06598_1]
MLPKWIVNLLKQTRLRGRLLALGAFAFGLSTLLSIGLAQALEPDSPYGMVDPVAEQYETSYGVYIENCATCHVALPPAVLPIETWQTLITDTNHYGVTLNLDRFEQQLMVNYLQTYSRRHDGNGPVPYRLKNSATFQALHPSVDLPQPLNLRSCVGCHINAGEQNYALSP